MELAKPYLDEAEAANKTMPVDHRMHVENEMRARYGSR